ncbi:Tetratricopeptide (TPR) repeat containing protein [Candidatus Methanophagaceae archaeon]|nr:Tetratricopeptide (TPR) repeat containing protein [Methanophagales archaeon]
MKLFQTPLITNFRINPALLGKPKTLPFDMSVDKKDKILSLLLWGLNSYQPVFFALDYDELKSAAEKRHVDRIKGVKVDKKTILCVSVQRGEELREVLKFGRRIPLLMMVIDILNQEVPASRKWLFQLKNDMVDAIRRSVYEDKRIDDKLLDGSLFEFCLKNFEDPIDVIEFLDLAISARLKNKSIEEARDEAFVTMVCDMISVLKTNQIKTLLSLIIANNIPEIKELTTLSEEDIDKAINELQKKGMVHLRNKKPVLPIYLRLLGKPGLLALVMIQIERMVEDGFDEIDKVYSKIGKEIAPKEVIERSIANAETVRMVSYPFPEIEELDKFVLALKAPFIVEVSKVIENPNRIIEISNEVLFKTIEERIRGIALCVRALAYIKKGNLEESRRDIDDASKVNPEVSKFSARFYLSYGDLYRERAIYEDAIECYDTARKLADKLGEKLWTALAIIGIAEVHTELANYEEAEKLCREGLRIAEVLGEKGKRGVARAFILLGGIQYNIGDTRQAIEYYEQALSIDREMYGDRHPNVATGLSNIGLAWYARGESKKALEYLEQALGIDKEVYGDRHPAVATILNNIGLVWQTLGEPQKALECYKQALSMYTGVYGEKHPNVANTLNNIGSAWRALDEPKKALEYYKQALFIDKKVYGDRHPSVATYLGNIGEAWNALGDSQRAKEYFQQAYNIFRESYGDEHPSTKTVKRSLDSVT